jgi:hypothetical protein
MANPCRIFAERSSAVEDGFKTAGVLETIFFLDSRLRGNDLMVSC